MLPAWVGLTRGPLDHPHPRKSPRPVWKKSPCATGLLNYFQTVVSIVLRGLILVRRFSPKVLENCPNPENSVYLIVFPCLQDP